MKPDLEPDPDPVLLPPWKQETRRFQRVLEERMKGLEPSTFCMARTWREWTEGDRSRQSAPLCEVEASRVTAGDSNGQSNVTENVTRCSGRLSQGGRPLVPTAPADPGRSR